MARREQSFFCKGRFTKTEAGGGKLVEARDRKDRRPSVRSGSGSADLLGTIAGGLLFYRLLKIFHLVASSTRILLSHEES